MLLRRVNYCTVRCGVNDIESCSLVVIEYDWNITYVCFMFIFRPNFDDPVAYASTIIWISCAKWDNQCLSSLKSNYNKFFLIGRILLHTNSTKKYEMYVQYLLPAILKYHVF